MLLAGRITLSRASPMKYSSSLEYATVLVLFYAKEFNKLKVLNKCPTSSGVHNRQRVNIKKSLATQSLATLYI